MALITIFYVQTVRYISLFRQNNEIKIFTCQEGGSG